MITYLVDIDVWEINVNFTYQGRLFTSIKIKSLNKQSFEVTACKNGLSYCTIKKRAKFENGKISISFGKQVFNVGTYVIQ